MLKLSRNQGKATIKCLSLTRVDEDGSTRIAFIAVGTTLGNNLYDTDYQQNKETGISLFIVHYL